MTEYICELDDARYEMDWTPKEEIVRCRDCEHVREDGTLCMFFASWEQIAGGDEYAEMPADVEPDGFCAWACRKKVDA